MQLPILTKRMLGACLAIVPLALCPHPASAQTPPISVGEGYVDAVTGIPWRLWRIPLAHTTPDFILNEIKQAYRPQTGGNEGMATLTKGKSDIGLTSTPPGLGAIIPNRRDNSLLVFATPDGYQICKTMILALDIPPTPPRPKHPAAPKLKSAQVHSR